MKGGFVKKLIFRIAAILMVVFFFFMVILPYGLNSDIDFVVALSQISIFIFGAGIVYEIIRVIQYFIKKSEED